MNHRELTAALTPLHGAGEARAIVRWVMEERFGLSQTELLLGKDTTLSSSDRAELEKIAQRLLAGEPVQHILGFAEFCGHRFRVSPDVLIPRPETEELVRWGITSLQELSASLSSVSPFLASQPSVSLSSFRTSPVILDLCTGSGCIAISLALACPESRVLGVDISNAALSVAKENAKVLGVENVEFVQGDIKDGTLHPVTTSLIISNPPYVRLSESSEMTLTVLDYEPSLALFVPDDDPLCFYHAIARIGKQVLVPGGMALMELNTALAHETADLFAVAGYVDIQLRDDQFGRPRMLRVTRPLNS